MASLPSKERAIMKIDQGLLLAWEEALPIYCISGQCAHAAVWDVGSEGAPE